LKGTSTAEAEFVRLNNDKVVLRLREDSTSGREIEVPLAKLAPDSQALAKTLAKQLTVTAIQDVNDRLSDRPTNEVQGSAASRRKTTSRHSFTFKNIRNDTFPVDSIVQVFGLKFGANNTRLAAWDIGAFRLINLEDGKHVEIDLNAAGTRGSRIEVHDAEVSSDGRFVTLRNFRSGFGGDEAAAYVFDMRSAHLLQELSQRCTSADFSLDGKRIVVGKSAIHGKVAAAITIYELPEVRAQDTFQGFELTCRDVVFGVQPYIVAVLADARGSHLQYFTDGTLERIEEKSMRPISKLRAAIQYVHADPRQGLLVNACFNQIMFSRATRLEAPANLSNVIFGKNTKTWHFDGRALRIVDPKKPVPSHIHVSQTDKEYFMGSPAFNVSEPPHQGSITSAAIAGNGAFIATGGPDGKIIISSVQNGRTLAKIDAHSGPILAVHASDDGTLVASVGKEGRLKLWQRE
jgi:WD40 repeat protein